MLRPSGEPYNLRSKIDQANRDLQASDIEPKKFSNVPAKVTFDNTVVVLDSFEDIGNSGFYRDDFFFDFIQTN